jgi:hypothetical protein
MPGKLRFALIPLLIVIAGCAKKPVESPAPPQASPPPPTHASPTASPATAKSGKIKVTVYINVTSGCQAETVALLNRLGMDYHDLVDMEIIDFGSPEGERRWSAAGMDCMGILFNGSPALRFPDKDEQPKTVAFFMPAGFSWTHEDLQQAFSAMRAGKLEILTEDQAKRELAPKTAKIETTIHESGSDMELQINGTPVFTVRVPMAGMTPMRRAQAAKAALDKWAQSPIQPAELKIVAQTTSTSLMAGANEVIRVTPEDAKDAKKQGMSGVENSKQLAAEWLKSLKASVIDAMRSTEKPAPKK